jgi:hypothetical protein
MKSLVFKGILIFSLALNAAVAFVVVRHVWSSRQLALDTQPIVSPAVVEGLPVQSTDPVGMREFREKQRRLMDKKVEVLDIIAAHPGDLSPAQKSIDELLILRTQMERAALARISRIMASIPEDKRPEFLARLKNRACRGPGMMGPGGPGRKHRGPMMGSENAEPLVAPPPAGK